METTKWSLDPAHSDIVFKIKHLMISSVSGKFGVFNGSVETNGDDFSTARVQFSADINSINTNNEQRDEHLRNGDFFDAENHPKLLFESTRMEIVDNENYKLQGNLTLRGITKPIALNVEFGGATVDPWGGTRAGFSISGKINRKDFGIDFSMVSETGGILLGEEVKISADVEVVKQAVLEAA